MILALSGLLWLIAALAVWRGLRRSAGTHPPPRVRLALWGILIAGSALFLSRPHEDVFGGQDPGSYINAASAYARHNALFYRDPLLAQVPVKTRPAYFYGHRGFGRTKDACLWVRDLEHAIIGPWFQPAYPILMSGVAQSGDGRATLYVAPLLALLAAVATACLAARLAGGHAAGVWAFLFFVFNPVMAWNGRSPRAELGAAFFLLAGWNLLLAEWEDNHTPLRRWWDVPLGLLCLAIAPFFHATAWFGVLPSLAILAVLGARSRPAFRPAAAIAAAAVVAWLAQARFVTDCYNVLPFASARLATLSPAVWAIVAACAVIAAGLLPRAWRRRLSRCSLQPGRAPLRGLAAWRTASGLAAVAVIVLVYAGRGPRGEIPFLPAGFVNYVSFTDFRGLLRLISRTAGLAALLGFATLWLKPGDGANRRAAFLAALFPGLLFTGWMSDYMMETRRMTIFPVPLAAIGMAATVTFAAGHGGRIRRLAATVLGVLLLAAAARGRTHLYRHTDFVGFHGFLQSAADVVRRENGILLAEYSRIAAPIEHLFGVPLLSLDNARRPDYAEAEEAWLDILRASPDQPAFFLTPFQAPLSTRFRFEAVWQGRYQSPVLRTARNEVPREISTWDETLSLYRMTPARTDSPPRDRFPFVYRPGPGNMGLRGFANMRHSRPGAAGTAMTAGQSLTLECAPAAATDANPLLALILHSPAEAAFRPPAVRQGSTDAPPLEMTWTALGSGWWMGRTTVTGSRLTLHLVGEQPAVLCFSALLSPDGAIHAIEPAAGDRADAVAVPPPMATRWARADAAMALPVPTAGRGFALLLVRGPEPDTETRLEMTVPAGGHRVETPLEPNEWRWIALPLPPPAADRPPAEFRFRTAPPWDPRTKGFPTDLGFQLALCVIAETGPGRAGE